MAEQILELRAKLDHCDQELQKLFQQRMAIISQVASYKQEQGLPIYDQKREEEILARYSEAEQEFFKTLLRLSRFEQSKVIFPYNIVLIGLMGVGKTSVGEKIAENLGRDFLDLDQLLETRFQLSIREFFTRYGEERFREEETLLIRELSDFKEVVIATGGGAVLRPENVALLKRQGKLVLLTAQAKTLAKRLAKDNSRPLLGQGVSSWQLESLWLQRKSAYEKAADLCVATDDYTCLEVSEQVIISLLASNKESQL